MSVSKYSEQERLAIGKRIYDGELNCFAAAKEYGISRDTTRNYLRSYKAEIGDCIPQRERAARAAARREAKAAEKKEIGKREMQHLAKLYDAVLHELMERNGIKDNSC